MNEMDLSSGMVLPELFNPVHTTYRPPGSTCTKSYGPWSCVTCQIKGVCDACARECHLGHKLEYLGDKEMQCECSKSTNIGCYFVKKAEQQELSERSHQWVCVSSLDGPNRAFVAEQILHATAKDIGSCIGIPDGYYLSVQNKNGRVKLDDECVVLEVYPQLLLNHKPDVYESIDWCLYVAPWEYHEIVIFVKVRIGAADVSPLSIGVKRCEIDELSGREFFDRCVKALGGEFNELIKDCELFQGSANLRSGSKPDIHSFVPLGATRWTPIEFKCPPSHTFDKCSRENRMRWKEKLRTVENMIIEQMRDVLEWGTLCACEFFTSDEWSFMFDDIERIISEHGWFCDRLEKTSPDMIDTTFWKVWTGYLPWETDLPYLIRTPEVLSLIKARKSKKKLLFGKKKEYASVNYGFLESVYSTDETHSDVNPSYYRELGRIYESMEPWNPNRELIKQAMTRITELNKTVQKQSHSLFLGLLTNGKERLTAPAEIVRIREMKYCFDDFNAEHQSFMHSLDGFRRLNRICEGLFGRTDVYKSEDGVKYCVKTSKSKCMPADVFEALRHREPEVMGEIAHPCLVRFLGSVDAGSKYMIITEYMANGSVSDLIHSGTDQRSPEWWNATTKVLVLIGTLLSLRYLHKRGHIHGMLSTSSILLDENHLPRVTNYGTGGALMREALDRTLPVDMIIAPEVQEGHESDEKTDVYYFGSIALMILLGRGTWTEHFRRGIFPAIGVRIPRWFIDMLKNCVSRDPGSRTISIDDILNTMRDHGFKVWESVSENDALDYLHAVERWELYQTHK